MRMLVVGAGALGGYYGGRLAAAGRDVTFLVRAARARQLAEHGLRIKSMHGDAHIDRPKTVHAAAIDGTYELILFATKSYGLASAADDVANAVGPGTAILPVLNGMLHLDMLEKRFGADRVLGGTAIIFAALGMTGEVQQFIPNETLTFGEARGGVSKRVEQILAFMQGANFSPKASPNIKLEMWEKWVALATSAGITCLMRGTIGDILNAPHGRETIVAMFEECRTVAAAAGYAPRSEFAEFALGMMTMAGSPLSASMMRDMESNSEIEGDHILGDLVRRAHAFGVPTPLLRLAYCHAGSYGARRLREARSVAGKS